MPQQPTVDDATDLTLEACGLLLNNKSALQLPELKITSLDVFLAKAARARKLSRAQKDAILTQTELLLQNLYPHLPFKERLFPDAKPFLDIQQIRGQLDTLSDFDFHTCVVLAFSAVRDSHTSYTLPSPYLGAVAFLPFQIRFYVDQEGVNRFIVAKLMATSDKGTFDHPTFRVGAEIIFWDSASIESASDSAAQLMPGANPAAQMSRGVSRLTARSVASTSLIGFGAPPFTIPTHSVVSYIPEPGAQPLEISFPWMVATGFSPKTAFTSTAFSLSESLASVNYLCKHLFRPHKAGRQGADSIFEAQFATGRKQPGLPDPASLANPSEPDHPFGYIRIRSFAGDSLALLVDSMLQAFEKILRKMNTEAPGGLILDIRGNPGGQIPLAERMLQMLSPLPIHPLLFHFAHTEAMSKVLAHFRGVDSNSVPPDFDPWLKSLPGDENPPEFLTPGRPLTEPSQANDTGQIYQGPVALLFDALSYSAADIFAAGFQDHNIGDLIGIDLNTGGGGGNVWSFQDLLDNIPSVSGVKIKALPRDCKISLAIRRCSRVGRSRGRAIEDVGVTPNFVHKRTQRDILGNNEDLYAFVCTRLSGAPRFRIDIIESRVTAKNVALTLRATNIRFLIFTLISDQGEKQALTSAIEPGTEQIFHIPIPAGATQLKIEGYAQPLAADRLQVPDAAPRIRLRKST